MVSGTDIRKISGRTALLLGSALAVLLIPSTTPTMAREGNDAPSFFNRPSQSETQSLISPGAFNDALNETERTIGQAANQAATAIPQSARDAAASAQNFANQAAAELDIGIREAVKQARIPGGNPSKVVATLAKQTGVNKAAVQGLVNAAEEGIVGFSDAGKFLASGSNELVGAATNAAKTFGGESVSDGLALLGQAADISFEFPSDTANTLNRLSNFASEGFEVAELGRDLLSEAGNLDLSFDDINTALSLAESAGDLKGKALDFVSSTLPSIHSLPALGETFKVLNDVASLDFENLGGALDFASDLAEAEFSSLIPANSFEVFNKLGDFDIGSFDIAGPLNALQNGVGSVLSGDLAGDLFDQGINVAFDSLPDFGNFSIPDFGAVTETFSAVSGAFDAISNFGNDINLAQFQNFGSDLLGGIANGATAQIGALTTQMLGGNIPLAAAGQLTSVLNQGLLSAEGAVAALQNIDFSAIASVVNPEAAVAAFGNAASLLTGAVNPAQVASIVQAAVPAALADAIGGVPAVGDFVAGLDFGPAGLTQAAFSAVGLEGVADLGGPFTSSLSGGGGCCGCVGAANTGYKTANKTLISEFEKYRNTFLAVSFFKQNLLPAMMRMTEQLTVVAMQQVQAIGMFLDAKHQLETQRIFQQLTAQAHKDYHPSEGLCTIGTNVRSLAASDRKAEFSALTISTRALQRQLRSGDNLASGPKSYDMDSRISQFRTKYCDPADNSNDLGQLCGQGGPAARRNKDIDFTRTFYAPLTLNLDYADGGESAAPDEEDILALSANLYGHTVPVFKHAIADGTGKANKEHAPQYLKLRSVIAKRSVAQNSFAAIAAMKAQGNQEGAEFMHAVLRDLGLSASDINATVGQRPSYFAQMEVLTKKLYQNPDFYTQLYDKPANVARKGAALQAIGLMQDRDIYRSLLRSEAILSVMLENALVREQNVVKGRLNTLDDTGTAEAEDVGG